MHWANLSSNRWLLKVNLAQTKGLTIRHSASKAWTVIWIRLKESVTLLSKFREESINLVNCRHRIIWISMRDRERKRVNGSDSRVYTRKKLLLEMNRTRQEILSLKMQNRKMLFKLYQINKSSTKLKWKARKVTKNDLRRKQVKC